MVNPIIKKFNKLSLSEKESLLKTHNQYNGTEIFLTALDKKKWLSYKISENVSLISPIDYFINNNDNNIFYFSLSNCPAYPNHFMYIDPLLRFCFEHLGTKTIRFYVPDIKNIQLMMDYINKTFTPIIIDDKKKLQLLVFQNNQYDLVEYEIQPIENLDINLNYNNGFYEIHNKLIQTINNEKSSFNILHGKPGTGKTTYIKHLASLIYDKDIVYLPPNVATMLSTPAFVSNLSLFKDKVVIIEDAEEILVDHGQRSQAISNILNITDGILGDIFNIHFIFSFNIDIHKIDQALLRKGRLNLKYEFGELKDDKVNELCNSLNITMDDIKDIKTKTVSEIYNYKTSNYIEEVKKIGF